MTHIITAIDITGRRWFRIARHHWQANRDNHCHFQNAIKASKIYHDTIVANRFLDPVDGMDAIELVQLPSLNPLLHSTAQRRSQARCGGKEWRRQCNTWME